MSKTAIPKYANSNDPSRAADALVQCNKETHKRVILQKTTCQQVKKTKFHSGHVSSVSLSSSSVDIVDEPMDMSGVESLENIPTKTRKSPTENLVNVSSLNENSSPVNRKIDEVNIESMDENQFDSLVQEHWFPMLQEGKLKISMPNKDWIYQTDSEGGIFFMHSRLEKTPTRKQSVTRAVTKKVRVYNCASKKIL